MGGAPRGCCRGAAARVFLQSLRCDRSSFCRLGVPSGVGPFKATRCPQARFGESRTTL